EDVRRAQGECAHRPQREEWRERKHRLARRRTLLYEQDEAGCGRGYGCEQKRGDDAATERCAEEEGELDVAHPDAAGDETRNEEEGSRRKRCEDRLGGAPRMKERGRDEHDSGYWQNDRVWDPAVLQILDCQHRERGEEDCADETRRVDAEVDGSECCQGERGEGSDPAALGKRRRDDRRLGHAGSAPVSSRACTRRISS